MKVLSTFCVILLHYSLISCRTVPHSEMDLPNEDMDSPTEEIANLLIPFIEKTLEKNSNQRARKLIQMLPYNDSAEATRWPRFSKKRVVEIMPLRRKQRRGEKPLAYLLAAPHSETERKERRRGVRKHETEDLDEKNEYEVYQDDDDSGDDSVEIKQNDNERRGHANMILRNRETSVESKEHSGGSKKSASRSESEELDSSFDEPLDYDDEDDSDDDAASREDDNTSEESNETHENLSEEENLSDKKEINGHVSEDIEEVGKIQERDVTSDSNDGEDDNIEEAREELNDDENEENVSHNLKEERNQDHNHKSDESDQINDSDDIQDWGTKYVSIEGILDNSDDSHLNGDNIHERFVLDSNRSSNSSRLHRERDRNVIGRDRRHEHKSYRLSFLFNR